LNGNNYIYPVTVKLSVERGIVGRVNCQLIRILLVSLIISLSLPLAAQDFKREYKAAKDFFEDKQYNFAMEAFKPLMVYDRQNPYVEYASFYYALSAYHQNFPSVAKDGLLQIKNLYPEWEKSDEVQYWLAVIYFQQGEIFQALRMIYAMKSPRDLASIERLKNYYLMQIYDEEIIRLILEEFPGEAPLIKRLILRKIGKGEYDQAKELIAQYGLEERDFDFPQKRKNIFKDKYRVAALFPFLAETLDPSPGTKRNQSTLELYQGMKLAADSLRQTGINIELAGYDTKRELETVTSLMEMEEMKSADVLVGPLFTDELPPVATFSKTNQVTMINPVSNSADFVLDNPNALLFQPDYAAIGVAGAEALAKRKIRKPCVVLYGESAKDSTMAFSFLRRAEELNIRIALTREIPKANSALVYATLVNPTKFDKFRNPIEFTIKKDSIGSVFVASDDELIFTKVISSVDRRADSVIIIGHDSWIDKPSMDFDKFERLHIMMASPEYTNLLSPEYQTFRKKYMSVYATLPSTFAQTGFECMMFLGQSLKEHGLGFVSSLKESQLKWGSLGRAFNFNESACNKEVPFVVFEFGELRVLY
jgi:ABC-type branched-subunit amino acid transport system substrate-binding protein